MTNEGAGDITCPECGARVTPRRGASEITCPECGLIVDGGPLDRRPGLARDSAGAEETSRTGPPETALLHDKGLMTNVPPVTDGATDHTMSDARRRQMRRVRRQQKHARTADAGERALQIAINEIRRMGAALDVSRTAMKTAVKIWRTTYDEGLVTGFSVEAVATAALYGACRLHEEPRLLAEISPLARIDEMDCRRAYQRLNAELELPIPPLLPVDLLPRVADAEGISETVNRTARELLETARSNGYVDGKHPAGLAAAAVYAAATKHHGKQRNVQQSTLADAAGVTTMTIRNHYRSLLTMAEER